MISANAVRLVALMGGLVLALAARPVRACAGCSNPNLLAGRSGAVSLAPGEVAISVHATGTAMNVVHRSDCPEIGPICDDRDEPPQLHDQDIVSLELRPMVAFGVTDMLALELEVPVRRVDTGIVFRRIDGSVYKPDYVNIHHRDETLAGLGDPWLLGRGTVTMGPVLASARAGVGLPVGSTVDNPFRLGREGRVHQHIQFGAGMPFPVVALDAAVPIGPVRASGYAQGVLFVAQNNAGYQPGNRISAGLAGDMEAVRDVRLGAALDMVSESPERWDGRVEQDGNVGRIDVLVGGMASLRMDRFTVALSVKAPVVQYFARDDDGGADPGQLTYPCVVGLSVSTMFGDKPETVPVASGVLPLPM